MEIHDVVLPVIGKDHIGFNREHQMQWLIRLISVLPKTNRKLCNTVIS